MSGQLNRWSDWRRNAQGRYHHQDGTAGRRPRFFWPSWWKVNRTGFDTVTKETRTLQTHAPGNDLQESQQEQEEEQEAQQTRGIKPMSVKGVDLQVLENALAHHTDEYEMT